VLVYEKNNIVMQEETEKEVKSHQETPSLTQPHSLGGLVGRLI